jgi:hypothetical protein
MAEPEVKPPDTYFNDQTKTVEPSRGATEVLVDGVVTGIGALLSPLKGLDAEKFFADVAAEAKRLWDLGRAESGRALFGEHSAFVLYGESQRPQKMEKNFGHELQQGRDETAREMERGGMGR